MKKVQERYSQQLRRLAESLKRVRSDMEYIGETVSCVAEESLYEQKMEPLRERHKELLDLASGYCLCIDDTLGLYQGTTAKTFFKAVDTKLDIPDTDQSIPYDVLADEAFGKLVFVE